ncbi:LpqB family beta-propeller domain-containing protein [Candidatus Viridilinea mediisalina]|uniref:Anaphase-promoting complex subunit 4-like WD40 domain-containing protein n=1 Tax=Candidatus Viridilinea mediisalina TaxID=2024553 RepID=A0A2A6RKK9_9CHLR|nr:LpqB family beta-propeller domain-containing protein [Candidatus Viridilinea mediisalina]PDW03617.1 hypothetical protein CJ255_08080 [Candidatus Viridilinea mediisalina]
MVPFVLMVCAEQDAPALRLLAQRLELDGLALVLALDLASPRAQHEALRKAAVVMFCLSHRALPADRLPPTLANLLDLLPLTPSPQRLVLALRLTSCDLPEPLAAVPALDLFRASGYERLLTRLREHTQTLTPPPQAPAPAAPDPAPPAMPALSLRGVFELPSLEQQGQVRRLGRGGARGLFLIDTEYALVVSGGGPALMPLAGGPPLWAIDCPTNCVALSPSGHLLALAAATQIVLWDLATGKVRTIYSGHKAPVTGLAFAPDERMLASVGRDRSLRLWRSSETGRAAVLLATLGDQGDTLTCVAFSPDGSLIAAGGVDRSVRVWRSLDRVLVQSLSGHGGAVETLAFSPDGNTLAAGSRGRQVRLWDVATWRLRATLEGHAGALTSLAFSPDTTLLASGADDHSIRLWRGHDGKLLRIISEHRAPLVRVAFSPDGTRLASVAEDHRLLAWEPTTGQQVAALQPCSAGVTSLALSPDAEHLVVGSSDGITVTYKLNDATGGRTRQREHRGAILDLSFATPSTLISASADRTIRACHTDQPGSTMLLQIQGGFQVLGLAAGGRLLACRDSEATVQLWQLTASSATPGGAFWRILRGIQGRPRCLSFSPQADALALASDSGALQYWRLANLAQQGDLPLWSCNVGSEQLHSLAFSADGKLLAAGGQTGSVSIWDTETGTAHTSFVGQGHAARSIAFAPDGHSLALGDATGSIIRWRLGQRKQRPPSSIQAHAGAITRLAYAPNGTLLVSGAADGTVRLWRV